MCLLEVPPTGRQECLPYVGSAPSCLNFLFAQIFNLQSVRFSVLSLIKMSHSKEPLSREERQIHAELLQLAGGVGCMASVKLLNGRQKEVAKHLKRKGYIALTTEHLTVVLST
jgi:hypothetical protein